MQEKIRHGSRVTRRSFLQTALGFAASVIFDAHEGTIRAQDSVPETGSLGETLRRLSEYSERVKRSPEIKSGSSEEAFDFLMWQPSVPSADRLPQSQRKLLYPIFSNFFKDTLEPSPDGVIGEGAPVPSIPIAFPHKGGVARMNSFRATPETLMLTARSLIKMGQMRAMKNLEQGIDAGILYEPNIKEFASLKPLSVGMESNKALHGTFATIVGRIFNSDNKQWYPQLDAGFLYDLSEATPLRGMVRADVRGRMKDVDPQIQDVILGRSMLFLTAALEEQEVKAMGEYALGAQVLVGGKLVGIISEFVELRARSDGPKKFGYLVQGPDSLREVLK